MALTETTIQDKIEIVGEFKHVQVRTALLTSQVKVQRCKRFAQPFTLKRSRMPTQPT